MKATWGHRNKIRLLERVSIFCQLRHRSSDQLSMGWSQFPEFKAYAFGLHFLLHPQGTSEYLFCQASAGKGGSSIQPSGLEGNEKEIHGKSMECSAIDWPDQTVPGSQGLLSFKTNGWSQQQYNNHFSNTCPSSKIISKCISPEKKSQNLYAGITAPIENWIAADEL